METVCILQKIAERLLRDVKENGKAAATYINDQGKNGSQALGYIAENCDTVLHFLTDTNERIEC
jgi:hypothetical protein